MFHTIVNQMNLKFPWAGKKPRNAVVVHRMSQVMVTA
jgi:hypothetical protein